MTQLNLFDRTSKRRFDAWLAANPHVWELFALYSNEAIRAGHEHYSADAIVHRIRWHVSVETRGDEFKINNNYVAFLARMFADCFPQHAGFFRMRTQRAS